MTERLYLQCGSDDEAALFIGKSLDSLNVPVSFQAMRRCRVLTDLYDQLCLSDSATTTHLDVASVNHVIFWLQTLPADALPSEVALSSAVESALSVVSALAVSDFLGDSLCGDWAAITAQHLLHIYSASLPPSSSAASRERPSHRATQDISLDDANPVVQQFLTLPTGPQELVLGHVPLCFALSLPPQLHKLALQTCSTPFCSASHPMSALCFLQGLHITLPLPPTFPFNASAVLPTLSHLLSTSSSPIISLTITESHPNVPPSFLSPPKLHPPPYTTPFPALIALFCSHPPRLPHLSHLQVPGSLIGTHAGVLLLNSMPLPSLRSLSFPNPHRRTHHPFNLSHMAGPFELLRRCHALQSLDLSGNSLTKLANESMSSISAPFLQLTSLTHLSLADTGIDSSLLFVLLNTCAAAGPPGGITATSTRRAALKSLDISGLNLQRVHLTQVCQSLAYMKDLTRLDIARTDLCRPGHAIWFPSIIRCTSSLRRLDFGDNVWRTQDMAHVLQHLASHRSRQLEWLSVRGQSFLQGSSGTMSQLAPQLRRLTALTYLNISRWGIKEAEAEDLCGVLEALRNLREVDVRGHRLQHKGLRKLLERVEEVRGAGGMQSLEVMCLGETGERSSDIAALVGRLHGHAVTVE